MEIWLYCTVFIRATLEDQSSRFHRLSLRCLWHCRVSLFVYNPNVNIDKCIRYIEIGPNKIEFWKSSIKSFLKLLLLTGDKKGKITGNHFDSTASPQCLHSVTAVSPQWHRGDGKSALSITLAPVKRFASLYNVCI